MSHSQGERERKNNEKRGEPDEKSTCDRSSERGERKRELSFSYGKCFFLQKFLSTLSLLPPCLRLECSIFNKRLLFHVTSLSVQRQKQIDRRSESAG